MYIDSDPERCAARDTAETSRFQRSESSERNRKLK